MDFLRKFFGYFKDAYGGIAPYQDGGGKGVIDDYRWWLWIASVAILAVLLYFVFKKHKKVGKIFIIVVVSVLLGVRFINQVVRACIGAESPFWRAIPFHLCTVLTFVLPLTILCKWDKIKTPVFIIAMMGGMITMLVNDYFDNSFITFSSLEGMTAHSILFLIPIYEVAIGEFKIDYKKWWQVVVGMFVFMAWAMLANIILKFGYHIDSNYMYLMHNALPFGGDSPIYLLYYVLIFCVFMVAILGLPELARYIKRRSGGTAPANLSAGTESAEPSTSATTSTETEKVATKSPAKKTKK